MDNFFSYTAGVYPFTLSVRKGDDPFTESQVLEQFFESSQDCIIINDMTGTFYTSAFSSLTTKTFANRNQLKMYVYILKTFNEDISELPCNALFIKYAGQS